MYLDQIRVTGNDTGFFMLVNPNLNLKNSIHVQRQKPRSLLPAPVSVPHSDLVGLGE